jgi:hypothetical protein
LEKEEEAGTESKKREEEDNRIESKEKGFKRTKKQNEEREENKQIPFAKLLFFTFKEEVLISVFFSLIFIHSSSIFTSSISALLTFTFTPSSFLSIILVTRIWIIFISSIIISPPPSTIINGRRKEERERE